LVIAQNISKLVSPSVLLEVLHDMMTQNYGHDPGRILTHPRFSDAKCTRVETFFRQKG